MEETKKTYGRVRGEEIFKKINALGLEYKYPPVESIGFYQRKAKEKSENGYHFSSLFFNIMAMFALADSITENEKDIMEQHFVDLEKFTNEFCSIFLSNND